MTSTVIQQSIDLRSDIVGPLPPAMRKVLQQCVDGYRGYEMRESAEEAVLERVSADVLGMEDALFFPTCTMANQVALRLHCPSGSFFLADRFAHLCTNEAASTAALSGAAVVAVDGVKGHPTLEIVKEAVSGLDATIREAVALLWLENSHNVAGGTIMTSGQVFRLANFCKELGIRMHIDGARIWNAAASASCHPSELSRHADSISISLNKGLGAPQGAILAGSKTFISKAVRARTLLGGGWRPWPGLAKAGLAAIEGWESVDRDNRRAVVLGQKLSELDWLEFPCGQPQTNIVVVRPKHMQAIELVSRLKAEGVLAGTHPGGSVRLVTHPGVGDRDIAQAIRSFRSVGAEPNPQAGST